MGVRIVAVADTHLYHRGLRVPDGDLFVHAGDLCRHGSLDELRVALDWIHALPHAHKLIVAGNHDWAFQRMPSEARALARDLVYLEDAGCTVAGLRAWGSPWQPAFCDWAFNLPRGAPLAAKWALIPDGLDLLVTHGPPRGFGDASGYSADRQGCADLLVHIERARPRLHLFGHIHEDGGHWTAGGTTFVNCTTWECERPPTIIELLPSGPPRVEAPPARRA